ncbi:MAG: radical SAM protein [Chloroflexota bacterium]|nr:FxsB family radical SAM/SPASM domain protein [Chloroflexota bacterium]NOG64097.1 FxsB family radical SAM/SPASM domain protein [Chloroflexota bacterium]GIK65851.1 MAG: radical SAM protein [Chloroflexota bacterium]
MQSYSRPIEFHGALLKVASRCNLDCDYCYVYKHADQSWRMQPHFMDERIIHRFGERLDEYVTTNEINYFSICFHGGEPLLYTADRIVAARDMIRNLVTPKCELDFSLQTNGILLTDSELIKLENGNISISLSLDGPATANTHRLDHHGNSSFERTFEALKRLQSRPSGIFRGVIAVIDVNVPPKELFSFFSPLGIPRLDFLLPDATNIRQPPMRYEQPDIYRNWLESAFLLWFYEYPELPIRWFDTLLGSRVGIPSSTDAMGLGSVGLIVIETDGSYTDHDVFKIAQHGTGHLEQNLFNTSFDEVAKHPFIKTHAHRLSFEGVAIECKACPVVEACGGGSIMHRYHATRQFDAPTVYCGEMFSILSLATDLIRDSLGKSFHSEKTVYQERELSQKCRNWRYLTEKKADKIVRDAGIDRGSSSAAAIILQRDQYKNINILETPSEANYMWLGSIRVQSPDEELVKPFSDTIRFLPFDSIQVQHGIATLNLVQEYLNVFNSTLLESLKILISDLIFVESTVDGETGIFSFSDDKSPNVLYIASYVGDTPLSPDDLADSILHEFLHQVLHHIEQEGALLLDRNYPRFPAPWRSGLRTAGGFLHGTFVFTGLTRYWRALTKANLPMLNQEKANQNAQVFQRQASYGIASLREFALLTPRGLALLEDLEVLLGMKIPKMKAPGILTEISVS